MSLPYSPLYRAGDWVAISGQIGVDEDGLKDGFTAQLDQIFVNLTSLLDVNDVDLTQIAKVTVFLADMDDYAEMNQMYAEFFGAHRPARSAVAVAALPFGALVEVEAFAHLG